MKILLFLAYGDKRVYHLELTYSILSAARFLREEPDEIRIVLAADAANRRPDLPVEHLPMTPEMVHHWQMQGTYNHAIKAYVLHHALDCFDAPTILTDSDTIVRKHPREMFDRIGVGRTLMHAREGRLGDSPAWPEWEALIARSGGNVAGCPVTPDSVMHNSGILGLHPQDAALMDEVKAAMCAIRDHSDMFTAEQLAASLVFQARTRLSDCDDLVEHYWGGPRAYYHYQMNRMFPDVLNGGGIADPMMEIAPLDQHPPGKLRHRIAARLKRIQRNAPPEYASSYMAYLSALALRETDPELANVWATMALNMLKWGTTERQRKLQADFALFAPARIEAQLWMQPDLRESWQGYWAVSNRSKASSRHDAATLQRRG